MSKEEPDWLRGTKEFCRSARIEVMGWGPETLVVKAESPERARQVASQLRSLGLEPIEDKDDAEAGLLLLSRNPAATLAKQNDGRISVDVLRRPWNERLGPILAGALALWFFWERLTQPASKGRNAFLVSAFLLISLWDASRAWGWKLEMSPEELRMRRYFRWTGVPWAQISAADATASGWGRGQETITLTLRSGEKRSLGSFGYRFARQLRDRLSTEIAQRRAST